MSEWKDINAELQGAVLAAGNMVTGLVVDADELRVRYEVGNAQHKDAWEDWNKSRFLREAHEEVLDLILYLAMMRVVHGE